VSPLSLGLAVVAAGLNALSSVLQRRANRDEDIPFGSRLIGRLVRRPAWLGGFGALVLSFLLQATALRFGTLAAVEPVLAAELPITLALATWLLRQRISHRDATSAALMAAGLAAFLVALGPSEGSGATGTAAALVAGALTAAGVAALAALGRWGPRRASGAFLGAAAGSGFGLAAAMMKMSVAGVGHETVGTVLGRWQLYAMVVAGLASLLLVQAALQAGTLVAVQPGLTLMDPLVSVVWGTTVLGETTNTGGVLLLAAAGAAAMVGSAVVLSRSDALVGPE